MVVGYDLPSHVDMWNVFILLVIESFFKIIYRAHIMAFLVLGNNHPWSLKYLADILKCNFDLSFMQNTATIWYIVNIPSFFCNFMQVTALHVLNHRDAY